MDDLITDSYLWVLGMYELVRTLHQIARNGHDLLDEQAEDHLAELDVAFRRVRIPLAKLEPARRYENTDWPEAIPIFEPGEGIGWRVSEQDFITRRKLSDLAIDKLSAVAKVIELRAA